MRLRLPRKVSPILCLALAAAASSVVACQSSRSIPTVEARDTLRIDNAWILDGTGAPGFSGSVRIGEGRILEVGDLAAVPGEQALDARGLALAPGFIDTHSHFGFGLDEHPEALAAVSQGITTAVIGQDGASPFPLEEFFAEREAHPAAIHLAAFAGHGTLREQVLEDDFQRSATAEEITEMSAHLEAELAAGAFGLSSGLEYEPGLYAEPSELETLARVVAAAGGTYATHLRSEDRTVFEAVDEALELGRKAGLPVKISHLKLGMRGHWGRSEELLEHIDRARAEGIDITFDLYPYTFWQSSVTVLFPERDFSDRRAATFALEQVVAPGDLLFPAFAPEPRLAGKTLAEIAALHGTDPVSTLLRLAQAAERMDGPGDSDEPPAPVIAKSMHIDDVAAFLRWPRSTFCTDGALRDSHPRSFGAMTRILGRFVRERGTLSLPLAVHKMTGLAADHLGLADRGTLAPGNAADLVWFDPARVIDRATTADPRALSDGILGVWVAGERVYEHGRATGRLPGRVLRRSPAATAAGARPFEGSPR